MKHSNYEKLLVPEPSDNVTVEPIDIATAFLDVGDNLGSPPMFIAEMSTPQTPGTRNNSVSPLLDVHSLV